MAFMLDIILCVRLFCSSSTVYFELSFYYYVGVQVSAVFHGNEAVLASSIYITTLDSCTWSSQSYPFFDQASILRWPLWNFRWAIYVRN